MKNIIINADDFGYSKENNEAVKLGAQAGLITSASLMANTAGFDHALYCVLPEIDNIDLGFHFNIAEGKSLSNAPLLCNKNGYFNNGFIDLIIKSQNKKVLKQIECEFRTQLEKILKYRKIIHIDSHVHIHSIPAIFNLMINLAEEYGIKYIRTQKEIPYMVFEKSFNAKYPVNIIKNIILNCFTAVNERRLKNMNIKTNDYFIGVLYTGFMDETAILKGMGKIKKENSITEVIFHPYFAKIPVRGKENNHREFLITQNPNFKSMIENSGFKITKFSLLNQIEN